MYHDTTFRPPLPGDHDAEQALREFIDLHAVPMRQALRLLKGPAGGHLCDRLCEQLRQGPADTRQASRLLAELRDILFLRHLDNANADDEARFAMIDPADPLVDDICLMAEQLDQRMRALASASGALAA